MPNGHIYFITAKDSYQNRTKTVKSTILAYSVEQEWVLYYSAVALHLLTVAQNLIAVSGILHLAVPEWLAGHLPALREIFGGNLLGPLITVNRIH